MGRVPKKSIIQDVKYNKRLIARLLVFFIPLNFTEMRWMIKVKGKCESKKSRDLQLLLS